MRLFVFSIIAVFALGAKAQTKVGGTIEAQGGQGDADPWSASLKLDIATPKLILKPYIGITKESDTTKDDINFTYSRSKNVYTSTMESDSKGTELNYGLQAQYILDSHNTLTAALRATHRDTETTGLRQESFANPTGSLISSVTSQMLTPTLLDDNLAVEAAWQHRTKRQGEVFGVKYEYLLKDSNREQWQEVMSHTDFHDFTTNYLTSHANIQEHNLQADWHRPVAKGHTVGGGLLYGYSSLNSTDRQELDNVTALDATFHHQRQKVGAFADYNMNIKAFSVMARAEYDYTRMAGRSLNDIIPMLRVQWRMDSHNTLQALFAEKIIRPDLQLLNPARIRDAYTLSYGNASLEGMHAKNLQVAYLYKGKDMNFSTTLQHIFANDGFNAIWMDKDDVRVYTWGNEGVRRAWGLTPDVEWTVSTKTKLHAKATVLWDKRIAYAINMAHEHWGITTQFNIQQQLPLGILLNAYCNYSEGNTIDLYSYGSRAVSYGADLRRSFLKSKRLTATLAYSYSEYPRTVVTQGAYVGSIFSRSADHQSASLKLEYRF